MAANVSYSYINEQLISPREACSLLGVGLTTLYKFFKEGKLTPIRFGRRCTRVRLAEIIALIEILSGKRGAA